MTELEFALLEFVCREYPTFEGAELPHEKKTELLGQHILYKEVVDHIISLSAPKNSLSSRNSLLDHIINDIEKFYRSNNYKITTNEGGVYKIESAFPIIHRNDVGRIIAVLNEQKGNIRNFKQLQWLLIAAFKAEAIVSGFSLREMAPTLAEIELNFYDLRYSSLREVFLENGSTGREIALHNATIREELSDSQRKLEIFRNTFSAETSALRSMAESAAGNYSKMQASLDSFDADISGIREASLKSITDYEKSVREHLKTGVLGQFWRSRARWALASLLFSVVIFVALIGGGIWASYIFSNDIKQLINLSDLSAVELAGKDMTSAVVALQLTRAFLIAIPVVLYFWAIKLIVRFFMRSLLLLDDARQRTTIMNSYVQLVREGAVDDKVLAIIMWALCRAVPGHVLMGSNLLISQKY